MAAVDASFSVLIISVSVPIISVDARSYTHHTVPDSAVAVAVVVVAAAVVVAYKPHEPELVELVEPELVPLPLVVELELVLEQLQR